MTFSRLAKRVTALIIAAVSVVACNVETYEDGVARFNQGNPTVPPPPAPPPPAPPPPSPPPPPPPPPVFGPNFSEIQANVFTPTCATSTCHAGGAPAAGLNLSAGVSYAQLVNIASTQDAGIVRVAPFDPVNSYLVQKLEGTAATGGAMPPSGMLPQTTIDTIRTWITNGAIDDTVVVLNPIRVVSLSPAPNANLATGPASIIAGFDRDLDANTLNAMSFVLEASGNDGTFNDGNEVPIAAGTGGISVPAMNPAAAVFDLTGVALADDTYRVRLLGDGGNVVQDLDGNALDGEYSGMFPSGDGTAGGDFEAQFVVQAPVMLGPTLDQIQAVVFGPSCATSNCHNSDARANLELSNADISFMELVGVTSVQQNNLMLVEPFNSDNSYLVHKIENRATIDFAQMPPGQALDAAAITAIRTWIDNGADRNN